MILPSEEALRARRQGYRRRGAVCALAFLLMILSCVTPHIGVAEATGVYGRSLFPASNFFLFANVDGTAFRPTSSVNAVAAGLNVAYFGLSLQHLGLLFGVFTFWSLAAASLGMWTRRALLLGGWFFALSAPTVIAARQLLEAGDIDTHLGIAWIFSMLTGVIAIVGARYAKDRVDSEWYFTRPDWNG